MKRRWTHVVEGAHGRDWEKLAQFVRSLSRVEEANVEALVVEVERVTVKLVAHLDSYEDEDFYAKVDALQDRVDDSLDALWREMTT